MSDADDWSLVDLLDVVASFNTITQSIGNTSFFHPFDKRVT